MAILPEPLTQPRDVSIDPESLDQRVIQQLVVHELFVNAERTIVTIPAGSICARFIFHGDGSYRDFILLKDGIWFLYGDHTRLWETLIDPFNGAVYTFEGAW